MSLTQYRRKRRFAKTPEPRGAKRPLQGPLRFVVQKHAARRLHYDFRLELDGALKSWAVPKGPSLDPRDKRLAVAVEDHPLDYRSFEGIIPEGNYGAGSVIVWDKGSYETSEAANRRENEKLLSAGLEKGHLRIVLHGEKLRGGFSLVRLKGRESKNWLLIKQRDEFASSGDVTAEERSVKLGRTLSEIARRTAPRSPRKRTAKPVAAAGDAPRGPAPKAVQPMLATLADQPFDRAGWLFEPKWDGYRAIADLHGDRVRLYSRNHKSLSERFPSVVDALRDLDRKAVLDGEIVALDEAGRSQFQLLQNYQKTGRGQIAYYVFDLLHLDGRDLRALPLIRRKEILADLIPSRSRARLSEHVLERGIAFFRAAAEQGLEGVVAKNVSSPYREGVRSLDWLKIKTHMRQEAVIGGFTEPRGSRRHLGALLLGVYDKKKLIYIGHTGGGFDSASLEEMWTKLQPLVRERCPFTPEPRPNAPVRWVSPKLVCEVKFQEWTADGHMRQPIFLALRDDKLAATVRREKPVLEVTTARVAGNESRSKPRGASSMTGAPPLTNLDKVFWPKDGYTKGDLIDYYRSAAQLILPYLRDRPQSLHRHPNGIEGKSFFQKDVSRQPPPDWVETARIPVDTAEGEIRSVLCQNEATLLYLANLGCIEINPWNSRVQAPNRPDYLVIDLDPEGIPFPRVVEAAREVHRALDAAGAANYCKTSGKTGLHIYVPLAASYDYDLARQFGEIVASVVHRRLPASTSMARSPAQRPHHVYLDYLQNRRGQTLAAPYSVRPAPGATVSTPLKWSEVRRGLDPRRFTIRTIFRRIDRHDDLWSPVLGPGIDVADCLERLGRNSAPREPLDRRKSRGQRAVP